MNTTREFGSILVELNANGNYMATGYHGFSAVIKKGMDQDFIERLMTTQGLAGDMGFCDAVEYLTEWAA